MDTDESSNANTTLLGGYNFGFYENSTQLTGHHFKDPILVSAIVVNGICILSFAALAITTWWMKGKRARGRKVFAVLYALLIAMLLAYGRTLADEILHEYDLEMLNAYLVLPIFKQVLANGTDTTLLYVVYSLIRNRFDYTQAEHDSYKRLQEIHNGVFIVMVLFTIADASLYSYAQVYTVSHDNTINISNWYRDIHLSYVTVYCAATLEIFACAVVIFKQSRGKQTRISKCLVTIITPLLVLRSVANVAFTTFYVCLAHYEQKSTGVIAAVLLGITSVIPYTGLVVVGFNKNWKLRGSDVVPGIDNSIDKPGSVLVSTTEQFCSP